MTGHRSITVLVAVTALAATASGAVGPASAAPAGCVLPTFGPGTAYHPRFAAGPATADVTNPFFPLPVGRTYVYTGVKDGQAAVDVVVPSRRTRVIDRVRTRVVEDRLYLDGGLAERTSDYYAQDACGNVWYFGEDTAELDAQGQVVDTEGSFHAGVDGAQPGVFMPAQIQLGRRFRQEWYRGHAEDVFAAVHRGVSVTVPFGHFGHALKTAEYTALEPGVLDAKYYVRGIGEVFEGSVRGPRETLQLVDVMS